MYPLKPIHKPAHRVSVSVTSSRRKSCVGIHLQTRRNRPFHNRKLVVESIPARHRVERKRFVVEAFEATNFGVLSVGSDFALFGIRELRPEVLFRQVVVQPEKTNLIEKSLRWALIAHSVISGVSLG